MRSLRLLLAYGFTLATVIQNGQSDEGHQWSYEGNTGPDHWSDMHQECAGTRQSPINIEYTDCVYNADLPDIDFINNAHELNSTVTYIQNNGHTLGMESTAQVLVFGGGLPDTYKVAQAHFHWGSENTKGSEHQVDATPYPLEMHIVTYNFEKYSASVDDHGLSPVLSSGDQSGLAVFGVFFILAAHNNTKLDPLIKHFEEIQAPGGEKATVSDFNLWDLLPSSLRDYYRYYGSLTTPTCNEIVLWTLFEEKNTISEYQLNQFRKLLDEYNKPLVDNWRPVQTLDTRQVETSFKRPSYIVDDDDEETDPFGSATTQYHNLSIIVMSILVGVMNSFL